MQIPGQVLDNLNGPKSVEKADIFTKKTILEVDYDTLNRYIHEKYPELKKYELVAHEELNNYMTKTYDARKDEFEEEDWADLVAKNGNKHFSLGTILAKMAIDGYIEEGEYYVDIFW